MLALRLLGQFEVRRDDQPVPIASRKGQALLAYLALQGGTVVRREQVAGLLWPDVPETTARTNLRQVVWRLRQTLGGDCVQADDIGLAWPAAHWADTAVLLSQEGEAALTVYGGDLLPGFYEEWVQPERERLRQVFGQKLATFLSRQMAAGQWVAVIHWAERGCRLDPLDETLVQTLMEAHGRLGQKGQVTAVYRRCRQRLADELDLSPAPQTTALYERLMAQGAGGHNLPLAQTSLIGRAAELAELATALGAQRLITLTGAGGSGKTRLALEAAWQAAQTGQFPDGVWLVELAALVSMDEVLTAVASVLRIEDGGTRPLPDVIADRLRHKHLLLLLDNAEHLLAGCAHLARRLLQYCPHVVLLVTSRERLRLPGERPYLVPTLSVPQTEDDLPWLEHFAAVQLFCERARATAADFHLTPPNGRAVAAICRRLDGIPLALELAAARLNLLPVPELAARLDQMFLLLTGGSRTALPRQQTLRATLDWSYDNLTVAEQALLRRMSVLLGGGSLAAVKALNNRPDTLLHLGSLVEKSMVIVAEGGSSTRYRLLEPIRQYALEKMEVAGEATAVRDRHLAYYQAVAAAGERAILTPAQAGWLAQMAAEHANLRTALAWAEACASTGEADLAGMIAIGWYMQAYQRAGERAENRGQLLEAAALLADTVGKTELGQRLQGERERAPGSPAGCRR